jgi:hypothetical protein
MDSGESALDQTMSFNEQETLLINQKFIESELVPARISKIEIVEVNEAVIAGLEGEARLKAVASAPGSCTWEVVDLE